MEVITNSKTKNKMELKISSKQVEKIGFREISKCFKCSYVLDLDCDGSGFDTYILSTKEDSETIVRRLKDVGFTEIKVIQNKLQSNTHIK